MKIEINEAVAANILNLVDQGLVKGVGKPIPGQMCVEAAVCYALGLPHGDDPRCIAQSLRSLKIKLNDSAWSSKEARSQGLRRLALAQLGSKDNLDEVEFTKSCSTLAIKIMAPIALRAAASIQKNEKHKHALNDAANRCEKEGTRQSALEAKTIAYAAATTADSSAEADAATIAYAAAYASADAADATIAYTSAHTYAAYAYAYASESKKRDEVYNQFAEAVVQILIDMKAPGCQWLYLTEV